MFSATFYAQTFRWAEARVERVPGEISKAWCKNVLSPLLMGERYCKLAESHTGLILGLRPTNERQHYFVTMFLISWVQAYNQSCHTFYEFAHKYTTCSVNSLWPDDTIGDLGQYWLRRCRSAVRHQAITLTSVGKPSSKFSGFHFKVMYAWILKISIPMLFFKILPEDNELIHGHLIRMQPFSSKILIN